jgi:hypothetical protein
MKFLVWLHQVYFSFYGRFHNKIFKKACLRGKEQYNFLILGSVPTGGFLFHAGLPTQTKNSPDLSLKIQGTIFLKLPNTTYNSFKKHEHFSKNKDVLFKITLKIGGNVLFRPRKSQICTKNHFLKINFKNSPKNIMISKSP